MRYLLPLKNSRLLPIVLLSVFSGSQADALETELQKKAAAHRAKVQQAIADGKARIQAKKDELLRKRDAKAQEKELAKASDAAEAKAPSEAKAQSEAKAHQADASAKASDHQASVQQAIDDARERMRLHREASERERQEAKRAFDEKQEQMVAEFDARREESARSFAESKARIETAREDALYEMADHGLEDVEHGGGASPDDARKSKPIDPKLSGLYWAKQGGLLFSILAAAIGHTVARRRKAGGVTRMPS